MNGLLIANQLEMDLRWIGTGLPINWRRPCFGDWHFSDLAPDWDRLALDRHRTGDGSTSDRWWIEIRLALDWHWIDIRLAQDWLEWCWSGSIGVALAQTQAVSLELNRPPLRHFGRSPYSTLVPRLLTEVASDWPLIGLNCVNACQSMSIQFWAFEWI